MTTNSDQRKSEARALMAEWRSLHPEFSDEDWEYAMNELKEYIKLAWMIYRQKHPDLNLPESL